MWIVDKTIKLQLTLQSQGPLKVSNIDWKWKQALVNIDQKPLEVIENNSRSDTPLHFAIWLVVIDNHWALLYSSGEVIIY